MLKDYSEGKSNVFSLSEKLSTSRMFIDNIYARNMHIYYIQRLSLCET